MKKVGFSKYIFIKTDIFASLCYFVLREVLALHSIHYIHKAVA